jgi:hypothetical protein
MVTCFCLFTSKYIFSYQRCLSGKFDFFSMKKEKLFNQVSQIGAHWSCAMPVPHIFPVTRSKIRFPAEQLITAPLQLHLKTLPLLKKAKTAGYRSLIMAWAGHDSSAFQHMSTRCSGTFFIFTAATQPVILNNSGQVATQVCSPTHRSLSISIFIWLPPAKHQQP